MQFQDAAYLLVGIIYISIGIPLYLKRIPPNNYYGFRTKKTASDPKLWYEINAACGLHFTLTGMFLAFLGIAFLIVRITNPAILVVFESKLEIVLLVTMFIPIVSSLIYYLAFSQK